MDDDKIIELFFDRSEQALTELSEKYGSALKHIVSNILSDPQDVEECMNDVFVKLWNTIPPQRPCSLGAYICRIARNTALNRRETNLAAKRNGYFDTAADELAEIISSSVDIEKEAEAKEIASYVCDFLEKQPYIDRYVFIRHFWFADTVTDISENTGYSVNAVSARLFRIRNSLRKYLRKEGLIS